MQVTITTTGDVAEILEKRYQVMQTFFELRAEKISGFLADSMANALQDRINGHRGGDPMYEAAQKIEAEFRSFLDANEMQKLAMQFGGEPISQAAASGSSQRKKSPNAKRDGRPAFIDTGLYRANFRVEVKIPQLGE